MQTMIGRQSPAEAHSKRAGEPNYSSEIASKTYSSGKKTESKNLVAAPKINGNQVTAGSSIKPVVDNVCSDSKLVGTKNKGHACQWAVSSSIKTVSFACYSREGGYPLWRSKWIPAFAGMTLACNGLKDWHSR
ncbi:MAG: hypothetical protein IPM53_11965 [Anaerolineaceae bacterium]|nr:hypothetical protein [Anaerolineaceae bacterium]